MNILIYGRPGCTFCERAKDLCQKKGIPFTYQVVGEDITKEGLLEMVGQPVKTIPQIFKVSDGLTEYIGGYDELSRSI